MCASRSACVTVPSWRRCTRPASAAWLVSPVAPHLRNADARRRSGRSWRSLSLPDRDAAVTAAAGIADPDAVVRGDADSAADDLASFLTV